MLDHARTPARHAPSPALSCLRFLLGCLAVVVSPSAIGSPIDLAVAMWVRGLTAIVLMLPISIAGLGVREVSFVALLAPFGVPPAHGLALALLRSRHSSSTRCLAPGWSCAVAGSACRARPEPPDPGAAQPPISSSAISDSGKTWPPSTTSVWPVT